MKQKREDRIFPIVYTRERSVERREVELSLCSCQPLSFLQDVVLDSSMRNREWIVPASKQLRTSLAAFMSENTPMEVPVSVLLLHMSQLAPLSYTSEAVAHYRKRRLYHAPIGLLRQVLTNVQRVIRTVDEIIVDEQAGAIIIFPHVDQEAARLIVERIYHSINLLQAETMVPPLAHVTMIQLGIGTYLGVSTPLDMFLQSIERQSYCLTLRPALTLQQRSTDTPPVPSNNVQTVKLKCTLPKVGQSFIPFMELPKICPSHVLQHIPYIIAQELRCVPVGCDLQGLTVAMADPTNTGNIQQLQKQTGMAIFPVSCDERDLNALLTIGW